MHRALMGHAERVIAKIRQNTITRSINRLQVAFSALGYSRINEKRYNVDAGYIEASVRLGSMT